jgi:hypothetical protein
MKTAIANQTNTISDLPTYTIAVDYSRSLEEMIAAGQYDSVNGNITPDHFPIRGQGKQEVAVTLFNFNRDMESSDVVIAEMDKAGYRPAGIEELLALGESHPTLQREFPIIALGSCWQIPHDTISLVPELGLRGGITDRYLNTVWLGNNWDDNYRFLAVRK